MSIELVSAHIFFYASFCVWYALSFSKVAPKPLVIRQSHIDIEFSQPPFRESTLLVVAEGAPTPTGSAPAEDPVFEPFGEKNLAGAACPVERVRAWSGN